MCKEHASNGREKSVEVLLRESYVEKMKNDNEKESKLISVCLLLKKPGVKNVSCRQDDVAGT